MRSMTRPDLMSLSSRLTLAALAALLASGCGSDTGTTPKAEAGAQGGAGGGSGGNTMMNVGGTTATDGGSATGGSTGTSDAGLTSLDAQPPGDGPATAGDGPVPTGDAPARLDGPAIAPDAPPLNLCGNGVKDPGEACDVNAKDEASRCPDLCPVLNCTTRKLINANTCQAQCVVDKVQMACANGDGCCPAGCNANNDDSCPPRCDNGVQEPGETCDPLSNCPKSCPRERCEIRELVKGNTCQAECRTVDTVKACIPNDGCCPIGCTNKEDNDCPANCDNGVKEANETCDPRSTCPTKATCVAKGCQRYELKNPDTCQAACVPSEIFYGCVNGDGCCPPVGCNNTNDTDCKPVCGNGVVEGDELCEPGSGKECPGTCPAIGCNLFQPKGPDKCHVKCEMSGTIGMCSGTTSDKCCPAGCHSAPGKDGYDIDCLPVCGNGIIETRTGIPGEQDRIETCEGMDPMVPGSCANQFEKCIEDQDHVGTRTGMVGDCSFVCKDMGPRPCVSGDGFCPSNCSRTATDNTKDLDCKGKQGDPCSDPLECANGICMDNVCCASACTSICFKCEAVTGLCKQLPDGTDDFNPNICSGPTTCAHGKCLLHDTQPCLTMGVEDHTLCISDICEAGKCRPFSCHADQAWTDTNQCKTKNGQTCVAMWPCLNDLCDFASNTCVPDCSATTTTATSGNKPPMGTTETPGTCKLVNGQMCMTGLVCASGHCDADGKTCVQTCAADKVDDMGLCKCHAGKEVDMMGVCKTSNGFDCAMGSECVSGACDDETGKCVPSCMFGDKIQDMATGLCICAPEKEIGPAGQCRKKNDQPCMNGTECHSDVCSGFNMTCITAAECAADGGTVNGSENCVCPADKAFNGAGKCKKNNTVSCTTGDECLGGSCNIITAMGGGKCVTMCQGAKIPGPNATCVCGVNLNPDPLDENGCVTDTCGIGDPCDDAGSLCQAGQCVSACDGSHYQSGSDCLPKKGTGDSCTADVECTSMTCLTSDAGSKSCT